MKRLIKMMIFGSGALLFASCGPNFLQNGDSEVDDHRSASAIEDEDGFGLSEEQSRKKWGVANSLDCHALGLKNGDLDDCKKLVFSKNKAQRKLKDFCEHIGFSDNAAHAQYRALGCKAVEFSDKEIDKLGDCDVEGKDDDCRKNSRRLYRNFNQVTLNINAYVNMYEDDKDFIFDGMKGLNNRLGFLDDAIKSMEQLEKIQSYNIKAIKDSQLKIVHGVAKATPRAATANTDEVTNKQQNSIIGFCKKPANALVQYCKVIKQYSESENVAKLKPRLKQMRKVMLANIRDGKISVYHCKSAFGNYGGEPFIAKNGNECPKNGFKVERYQVDL